MSSTTLRILVCMIVCAIVTGCKSTPEEKPTDSSQDVTVAEQTATTEKVEETPKPKAPECAPDDEMCRVDNMGPTAFGVIDQGVTLQAILDAFGEPDKKDARFTEEASGDVVETWYWTEKGITIDFLAPDMTADVTTVRSFTLAAPYEVKGAKGVGIGSTKQEVLDVYSGVIEPRSEGEDMIIVGSIYGGIFFTLVDDKVSTIFVGAGAE